MSKLPGDSEEWTSDQAYVWGKEIGLDESTLAIFEQQKYNGHFLTMANLDMLKADGIKTGPASTIVFRFKQRSPPKENISITLLSDNGTVTSTHLLLNKPLPNNITNFRALVQGLQGSDLKIENLKDLKAAVYTEVNGSRSWQSLGTVDFPFSVMVSEGGSYKFKIQRFSSPSNSPQLEMENDSQVKLATGDDPLAASMKRLFSNNPFYHTIPLVLMDETLTQLIAFFNGRNLEYSIVTLLAMPGAGKTRSVQEGVSRAGGKMKRTSLVGGIPEESALSDMISKLESAAGEDMAVVIHFDEVQAVFSEDGGAEGLKELAKTCTVLAEASNRRKFVFTGTNINAKQPVNIGSALKSEPVRITGSFDMQFVLDLYDENFPSNSGLKEKLLPFFESCRHNRRVTEIFLKLMYDSYEDVSIKVISANYWEAVTSVSESISTQLGQTVASPAACRFFRALLRSIATGSTTKGKKGEKLVVLCVSGEDLQYIAGGGLNVYKIASEVDATKTREVQVYYPEGCVMEILARISQAVQPRAAGKLLSFLDTSRVKSFTLGWFFEALVICDLQKTTSELEDLLSNIAGRRHSLVQEAAAVVVPQLWKKICENRDDEFVSWVRDEMNSHQNRWIDIGYRTDKENERVILECKSGLKADTRGAAKTFFEKSIELARENADLKWVSVFLCLKFPDFDIDDVEDLENLEAKIVVLEEGSFLATALSLARQSEDEAVEMLKTEIQGTTKLGEGRYYEGSSQVESSSPKRPKR